MASSQKSEARHPLKHRILHELIMVSVILLILTGLYIHRPFVGGGGFLMSMSRGVHNFAAIVLIISTVLRLWCMFVGSGRDCRLFIPTWADLKLLPKTLNYYAYVGERPVIVRKYNPLQMLTYLLVFILIIFQIVSGLALKYPDGAFSWFNYGWFNNEIQSRMGHFVVMWLFIMFLALHMYLNIREKFEEIKEMHLFSTTYEPEEVAEEQ